MRMWAGKLVATWRQQKSRDCPVPNLISPSYIVISLECVVCLFSMLLCIVFVLFVCNCLFVILSYFDYNFIMSACSVSTAMTRKRIEMKYYTFPKNVDLARQWVQVCRREDKVNIKNAPICSAHFKDDCFFIPLQKNLLEYFSKRFRNLKSDGVPRLKL